MSDQSSAAGASGAAATGSAAPAANAGPGSAPTAPKKPLPEGNPAFRMMGLPRLRLPSRNWLIFLSVTGGFASAVLYDKYQTRRARDKWCSLVAHLADERLDTHTLPRRLTVYLAAPPGDGLRAAREHFHLYVKPVLVAAAMDWDVVEGRKEGDVRFKTAERARKRRRDAGEGLRGDEEEDKGLTVEAMRKKAGTREFDGVAGDLVVGRNTWKEYVRGLHEGWLGPVDAPAVPEAEIPALEARSDSPAKAASGLPVVEAAGTLAAGTASTAPSDATLQETTVDDASPAADPTVEEKKAAEEKAAEEKPKPRQPPPYIQPEEYSSATASPNLPSLIGPSIGVPLPHMLGFRNTPIRVYRFLTRRYLADSIGRDVAAAVLASHRPYETFSATGSGEEGSASGPEQARVLLPEERNWWKTTFEPRKEHEESVWIEEVVTDERVLERMRAFHLTAEDEDRARRIGEGKEKALNAADEEQ